MHTIALSEFRAHASAMLDLVEQGETVRILRHGKPVAELVPLKAEEDAGQSTELENPVRARGPAARRVAVAGGARRAE